MRTMPATIPHQTFMVFQLMFAIITPALITGAFAERMKFSARCWSSCSLWAMIVYFPLAHMVWGKGGLLNAFLGGKIPALDFAGGTVVHISSGFSALVCAIYLGKRLGYPQDADGAAQPRLELYRRLPALGRLVRVQCRQRGRGRRTGLERFRRDAFRQRPRRHRVDVVEWIRQGKPTVLGGISGAVAGLVAITPASGFVTPMSALIIGFIAGVICFLAVTEVKKALGYDDSLDAFGVHGVGGFTGAMLTGVFANSAVNTVFKDASGDPLPSGLIEGNPKQFSIN